MIAPRQQQSGYIVLGSVLALALIASLIFAGFSSDVSRRDGAVFDDEKSQWAQDAGMTLDSWYRRNAWTIDSDANAIASSTILTQSGVTLKYGAQVKSSVRLNRNGVSYHIIAIWLPQDGATGTAFDAATGTFTEGTYHSAAVPRVKYHLTNGNVIEVDLYQQTAKSLQTMASRLEAWFSGSARNASSFELGSNWFRTPSCSSPDSRYLPCADTYTDAGPIFAAQGIGAISELSSAWAQPIQLSNLLNASTVAPYSVSLQTATPWGGTVTASAIQPTIPTI